MKKKFEVLALLLALIFAMGTGNVFAATGPSVTEVGTKLNSFGQDTSNWEYTQWHGVKGFCLPGQASSKPSSQVVIVWEKQNFLSVVPSDWELSANSDQSITEIDTKGQAGIITLSVYPDTTNKLVVVKDGGGNLLYAGLIQPSPKQQDAGIFSNPDTLDQSIRNFCLYIQGF